MEPTYAAVARLVARYAEYLDTGDLEGMAAMFADATFRSDLPDGIVVFRGADEVLAAFTAGTQRDERGLLGTRHVTTNLVVDEGPEPGTARARSYFTVLQARPGFPLQVVVAGGYRDEFRQVDGEWRFADRLVRLDLEGDLSRHLVGWAPSGG
jgi:3-phenylpropionate/cinnamic acid dioxygenase small subunit